LKRFQFLIKVNVIINSLDKILSPELNDEISNKLSLKNYLVNSESINISTKKKLSEQNSLNSQITKASIKKIVSRVGDELTASLNFMSSRNLSPEIKEIRAANQRLKFLEDLEKRNNTKIQQEIEKIQQGRIKKEEEKLNKYKQKINDMKKVEGHIKRLNYLYKDNNNIFSSYLAETGNNIIGSKIIPKSNRKMSK
jgi:hypothetical protein